MTCREAAELLQLFFDGEIKGARLREVAVHVTECEACRREVAEMAAVQRLVVDAVSGRVAGVDLTRVALGVAERLEEVRLPASSRLRALWSAWSERGRAAAVWAGATAALALVGFLWWRGATTAEKPVEAALRNEMEIQSLSSSVPTVAMWSEPAYGTTVIWVAEETAWKRGNP